ncbi:MAG TPA: glycerophosphodiester phosphodiesterase family protein [Pyrinomonadaceae bacterium]|jgi:glycerophosphoryl diester phosphodiesterase
MNAQRAKLSKDATTGAQADETDEAARRPEGADRRSATPDRAAETATSDSTPLIIAHRGASAHAPENTLAAFARAFDDGADGLEFDVRLARDGVPVVIHDATLERTASRRLRVSALTSVELGTTDVGTWFNRRYPARARADFSAECVPTLEQVLQTFGARSKRLYVELKHEPGEDYASLVAEAVRLARSLSLASRVCIESFALEVVAEVKRVAPEIRTAALFERTLARPVRSARSIVVAALGCSADELALHRSLVGERVVRAARLAGLDSLVWTVDSPAWIHRAQRHGLSALITNQPARMRAALEGMLQHPTLEAASSPARRRNLHP